MHKALVLAGVGAATACSSSGRTFNCWLREVDKTGLLYGEPNICSGVSFASFSKTLKKVPPLGVPSWQGRQPPDLWAFSFRLEELCENLLQEPKTPSLQSIHCSLKFHVQPFEALPKRSPFGDSKHDGVLGSTLPVSLKTDKPKVQKVNWKSELLLLLREDMLFQYTQPGESSTVRPTSKICVHGIAW